MALPASQIRIPSQTLADFGAGYAARGTNGSNPWLDSLFYEAQWGNPLAIALNHETPVYSYYFLEPSDLNRQELQSALEPKLKADATPGADNSDKWLGEGTTSGVAAFSTQLKNTYRNAYQAWADVTNLAFSEANTPGSAAILNANAYFTDRGISPGGGTLLGSHQGLINQAASTAATIPLIQDTNAYVNQNASYVGRGSTTFATAVHEVGHGIGLSHPHDSGLGIATSGVFPGLTAGDSFGNFGTGLYGLVQTPFTVMSYKRGYTSRYINDDAQLEADIAVTPMALDVAAAQIKYGTNRNTRTENNQYALDPSIWQCIYDAGGSDWINAWEAEQKGLVTQGTNAHINLRPAEMNAIRPDSGLPMELYDFTGKGLSENQDLALNTMISLWTSGIGSPLGMGLVYAGKLGRILEENTTRESFLNASTASELEDIGVYLQSTPSNPLQIITALRQIVPQVVDSGLTSQAILEALNRNGANLTSQDIGLLVDLTYLSKNIKDEVEDIYSDTFANSPTSGPESKASHIARLQEEQQRILARSAQGISGYANFFEGYNGGSTVAAGVIIENARGGSGDDVLIGNAERNRLIGGRGKDILEGYLGKDTLTGGTNKDIFVYTYADDSRTSENEFDVITDFSRKDKISLKPLRNSINESLDPRTRSIQDVFTFDFIGSQPFSGINGEVRFANSSLLIDIKGNGQEDMRIDLKGFDDFTKSNLIL